MQQKGLPVAQARIYFGAQRKHAQGPRNIPFIFCNSLSTVFVISFITFFIILISIQRHVVARVHHRIPHGGFLPDKAFA